MFANLCICSKVTEISRISVVMYVSDQFVDGKLQFTLLECLQVYQAYRYSINDIFKNAFISYSFISTVFSAFCAI